MLPANPSRRHLLRGLVAGLFGWLGAGRANTRPAPPPSSNPADMLPTPADSPGSVWIYSYDAAGNYIGRRCGYPGDSLHSQTFYTYHPSGLSDSYRYEAGGPTTTFTYGEQ